MTVNKPCCIDIYHGDNVNDSPTALGGLDRIKTQGIFALIHKASEGVGIPDNRYDARRAKWMSGNVNIAVTDTDGTALRLTPLWGAYHFGHGTNPAAEASYFLMVSRLKAGDMPFLDWEAVGASGFQPSIEYADAFCQAVEDALGHVCGVYGGNVPRERFNAGKASSDVLDRFSKRPLWFCAYGGVKDLTLLPEPWKETGCFLWQDDGDSYGPGPHSFPGIDGKCDNSTVVAPMTFATLHEQWGSFTGGADIIPATIPIPGTTPPPGTTRPPVADNSLKTDAEKIIEDVKEVAEEIEEFIEHKGKQT